MIFEHKGCGLRVNVNEKIYGETKVLETECGQKAKIVHSDSQGRPDEIHVWGKYGWMLLTRVRE